MSIIKIIKKCILYTFGIPFLVRKHRLNLINRKIEINELKKINQEKDELLNRIEEELENIKYDLY